MEKIIITKDFVKNVRRFNVCGRTLEFKLKDVPKKTEPVSWIKAAVGEVVKKVTENLLPEDQVAFNFGCKDLARGDGWVRFRPASEITLDDVWEVIASIYQSNSIGLNTETFCLGVTSVRMPTGKGRGKNYNNFDEECTKRRGLVSINNMDNLCLPRALVVAKAYADKDPEYVKVRRDVRKLQTFRARQLMIETGVIITEEGAGIPELQKFQEYLSPYYRIVVYKYGSKGRDLIFSGVEGTKNLNLLHHNGHYSVITSCSAAFACVYFCEECNIPFNTKNRHRCAKTCSSCQQSPPCGNGIKVRCQDCFRNFKSPECYENHRRIGSSGKSSVCNQIRLCDTCFKTVKTNREHTCGEIFCKICQLHRPDGHLCYIQPDKGSADKKEPLFVFYDLETLQERQLADGSFKHEPNLCVFKQCCNECINTEADICEKCGQRVHILEGPKCIENITAHLLQIRRKFKDVVVVAHNGQAFDHQFMLNYILMRTSLTPELIMRGTKIILMQLENVKFIDSLNYFPMALSALPKALGLPDKFKKGYFPHLFNRRGNQKYFGPLPAIENYSPDTMKVDQREDLLKWYEGYKNTVFDFQKEIVDYCVSDVEILTEACLKFRQQMIATTNVCPFTEACTIASACNKVYRRNFLKPNTIGIIPKGGYRLKDNQSKIALQWLIWNEYLRQQNIMHAAKGCEVVLSGLKVDGYCEITKQVFEFHGCYWHGCLTCFKYRRDDPLPDNPAETMHYRYESTQAKTERLTLAGYEVIVKWECEFTKEMKENPEIEVYTSRHPLLSCAPLNPRDAFYGGRTGNCQRYYRTKKGEKIKYVDVCSLYPWVCKYGKFPVGHPEVLVEFDNIDLNKTDGLIKCKILPPQNLYHPVLPVKMNNKLMFVLCRLCGEYMSEECTHSEEQRALTGTWVIDEVLKAEEKGYKILHIYEVWKYQVEQYDVDNKIGGLFVDMMNKFIKIKQEASGWPGDCVSDDQKKTYIDNFFEREGINLEFEAILKNAGSRSLAKLMLNSFWGKLGQRENQPKTKIINKPEEFFNMLTNPALEVNSALPINDDVLVVNYQSREESCELLSTVNVCLAAYTTAQARLKLYTYLELLEDRVLYYDTDSVIYVSKPDCKHDVPTGDFIGDMTDELEGYGTGSYISEFVSGGPKNYAFKFHSTAAKEEKIVCKVKGICLNYAASQLVNFSSIKEMVLKKDSAEPILVESKQFRRTNEHEVVTKEEAKIYKPNSTKRIFHEDHSSSPYGFKKFK